MNPAPTPQAGELPALLEDHEIIGFAVEALPLAFPFDTRYEFSETQLCTFARSIEAYARQAIAAALASQPPSQAREPEGAAVALLHRIRQWDMLDAAADGAFWKREIDAALTAAPRSPALAVEPQCQGDPGECAFNKACMYACGRCEPPVPIAEIEALRKDAQELRFYRQYGFPYVDWEHAFDEPRVGMYAIKVPLSWPHPEGEGTCACIILHAFTVEQLYVKACQHIESLGPNPGDALSEAGQKGGQS